MIVRRLTCALAALSVVAALTPAAPAVAMNKFLRNRIDTARDACAGLGGRPSETVDGETTVVTCLVRPGSRLDNLMLACRKAEGEFQAASGACRVPWHRNGIIRQRR